ncbi:MAG: methyl-accepting chemotaxis protein [Negativicutes bacterium]|nr:methyl-accepting chemotaxis protein [Negativicutes bacterium]
MVLNSIKHKIIVAMVLTGLIGATVVGIYNIYETVRANDEEIKQARTILYEQFDRSVKLQVETVLSLLQDVYDQQQKGLLPEAEAKKRAADIIRNLRFDNGNYFWVDTAEGVNVVLLGRAEQEGKSRYEAKDAKGFTFVKDGFVANGIKPEGGYTDYWFAKPNQTEQLPKRAYTRLFKPYNWVVGTGNWTDDIDAFVQKKAQQQASQLRTNILLGVFSCLSALVLSAILAFYLGNSLAKPFLVMRTRIMKMADGDYSQDVDPAFLRRADEFGDMAKAFDALNKNMRNVIRNIMKATEQVSASAEELTASAEQSAQAANQVAVVITEVADGAEKQLKAVDETASTIGQMTAGIQQIAVNANTVAGTSSNSAEAAAEGSKAVEKAISQMEYIEQTVTRSSRVVAKLGDRSKEIGQIVGTISGIAGQTNLLALNAAIEAARAGEAGRGFAVVAEEVRKLAEQSQDAAKQIAGLIGEIQQDTDSAVVAMSEGTKEVQVGAQVVNEAGDTFKHIFASFNEVTGQIREISAAIQQMAGGSQQVVAAVREIDVVSKDTAGRAQTVSAATEEQSATMEEIAASSQALARMAEELAQAVSRFKI